MNDQKEIPTKVGKLTKPIVFEWQESTKEKEI